MFRLRNLSEDTALFPWNAATPHRAVESTIAVVLALALGEMSGHRSAAAIAAGSAFTVGFAVFHAAMASTLFSMGLLTVGIASCTLAGSLGSPWTWATLLLVFFAALNYGLLAGISPNTGWIGQQCAVFVIVNSYFSDGGVHYAAGRAAMVLLGGGMQMLVYYLGAVLRLHTGVPMSTAPLGRQLHTRASQLWKAFRAELHWDHETTGYILRLVLTVMLSTAVYKHFGIRNGYWAPMTALLVLKPQWAGTLSRGIARLAGTVVGAGVAALLALHPAFHHWTYFLLIVLFCWLCFALQAVNYAAFSASLTLYTVFLFAFGGFSERAAAHIRLFNTALGGLLALGVDFLWKQIEARRGLPPKEKFVAEPGAPPAPVAPRAEGQPVTDAANFVQ